jgi:hypothetical protein
LAIDGAAEAAPFQILFFKALLLIPFVAIQFVPFHFVQFFAADSFKNN